MQIDVPLGDDLAIYLIAKKTIISIIVTDLVPQTREVRMNYLFAGTWVKKNANISPNVPKECRLIVASNRHSHQMQTIKCDQMHGISSNDQLKWHNCDTFYRRDTVVRWDENKKCDKTATQPSLFLG